MKYDHDRNTKHDILTLDTLDGFDKKDQVIDEKVGFTNIKSVNNRLKRIKGFFINNYENPFF